MMNMLRDLMNKIDVSKNDNLFGLIIYARYPDYIKRFENFKV